MDKLIYTTGCVDKLKDVIVDNVAAIGGVGIGIAFIQVMETPGTRSSTYVLLSGL